MILQGKLFEPLDRIGRRLVTSIVLLSLMFSIGIDARLFAEVSSQSGGRPNVLMIICDDLNVDLSVYGEKLSHTPNMDRLAKSGTRFNNAFAQFSSCLPSRVSFLSGWSPLRTGVHDFKPNSRDGPLADAVYISELFKAQGYTTARLDKVFHIGRDLPEIWDISEEPLKRNEDGTMGIVWTGIEVQTLGLETEVLESVSFPAVVGEAGVTQIMKDSVLLDALYDGRTAKRATELLNQFSKDDKPFFMALGFRRPHLPWVAQRHFFELINEEEIVPVVEPGYQDALSYDLRRKMKAYYLAAMASVDYHVGQVLEALKESGQSDNTVIVLFGDHGYALGERGARYGKGVLWDRALGTTLIISAPGRHNVAQVDQPVGLLDIYPTLVEITGVDGPDVPLDGISLVPLLEGKDRDKEAAVFSYFKWGPWKDAPSEVPVEGDDRLTESVRTFKFRYIQGPDGRQPELYNVIRDPYHWHNLAAQPDHDPLVEKMKALLEQRKKNIY